MSVEHESFLGGCPDPEPEFARLPGREPIASAIVQHLTNYLVAAQQVAMDDA
jgi:hypothetical protein